MLRRQVAQSRSNAPAARRCDLGVRFALSTCLRSSLACCLPCKARSSSTVFGCLRHLPRPLAALLIVACRDLLVPADMGAGGFLEIGEASRKPDPEGSLSYGGSHGGASASEMPAGAGFLGGHHAPGSRGQHHRGQGGPGPRQVPRPRPPAPLSSTAAINAMARGEMLLGFTTPRMSNSFARRHGLNPKDNAMLNLQKLAIQAQQQVGHARSMHARQGTCWGWGSGGKRLHMHGVSLMARVKVGSSGACPSRQWNGMVLPLLK